MLSCGGAHTENERQILDYAKPAGPSRVAALVKAGSIRLAIAVVLFFAAVLVPHPQGIWYFGRRPQWLIAIDHAGLTVGPSDSATVHGWLPLLVLKLVVVSVPIWLIWRFAIRRNDGESGAG